jgi:xanthine dehydrogenase accessory factor
VAENLTDRIFCFYQFHEAYAPFCFYDKILLPNAQTTSSTLPAMQRALSEMVKQFDSSLLRGSMSAILAKKNLGTNRSMAPLTVGLGPGFTAGVDVDIVIETMRGHNLGRIIREGSAIPNTGIPGNIGGYTAERVIHAGAEGILYNVHKIGDIVEQGEEIAYIADEKENRRYSVTATIPGIIRGLIRDGYPVTKGFKIADIDPRKSELSNCFTISDKARCIAGSVLEVVCAFDTDNLS